MCLYKLDNAGQPVALSYELPYNERDYALFEYFDIMVYNDFPYRGVFPQAPTSTLLEVESKYCYNYTYFDWVELLAMAKNTEPDNPLRSWVHKIAYVFDCYEIYDFKPGDIIIQISFDC